VTSRALLVLLAPSPGQLRLVWYDVPSGQVTELVDRSTLVPEPGIDGYGAPIRRLDELVDWHP
jgi:hypothetical protein